jgi:hypothetical protein
MMILGESFQVDRFPPLITEAFSKDWGFDRPLIQRCNVPGPRRLSWTSVGILGHLGRLTIACVPSPARRGPTLESERIGGDDLAARPG